MPIYEFACSHCGHGFDIRFASPQPVAAVPCPSCDEPARRVLSSFAFQRSAPPAEAAPSPSPRQRHEAPLCLQRPDVPLLCHMDRPSAERWIAKVDGREEQFLESRDRRDRSTATRDEPPPPSATASTTHRHHGSGHDHAGQPH